MSSRRLLALLCVALVGIVVAVGLVVVSLTGVVGGAVYAVAALALLAVGALRGARLLAPPPLPPGKSCTCCTTSHFDPVKVV